MPSLYADRHLKGLVQRRVGALSDPNNGVMVSEKDALLDMMQPQYRREYERMRAEASA